MRCILFIIRFVFLVLVLLVFSVGFLPPIFLRQLRCQGIPAIAALSFVANPLVPQKANPQASAETIPDRQDWVSLDFPCEFASPKNLYMDTEDSSQTGSYIIPPKPHPPHEALLGGRFLPNYEPYPGTPSGLA